MAADNAGMPTSKERTTSGTAERPRTTLRHLILIDDTDTAFQEFREECFAKFQPSGPVEDSLVERIAASSWRVRRGEWLEQEALQIADAKARRARGLRRKPKRMAMMDALKESELRSTRESIDRYNTAATSDLARALRQLARVRQGG